MRVTIHNTFYTLGFTYDPGLLVLADPKAPSTSSACVLCGTHLTSTARTASRHLQARYNLLTLNDRRRVGEVWAELELGHHLPTRPVP